MTPPPPPSSLHRALARLVAAVAAWTCRARDRQLLQAMSENELRDLGIGRSQIPGLFDSLFFR